MENPVKVIVKGKVSLKDLKKKMTPPQAPAPPPSGLVWNPWTVASADIAFKANRNGIGDGEDKVGAECGTVALGQNSPYDMEIRIEGALYKCDVKKLDNNTFNTGVHGRNALRPIKHKMETLLALFTTLESQPIFTAEEKAKLKDVEDVSPDEMSVGNLQRVYQVCKMLNAKQSALRAPLPSFAPFADVANSSTAIEMSAEAYYRISKILGRPLPADLLPHQATLELLALLDHDYISRPDTFYKELNELVSIFEGLVLICVDEAKGYCILKEPLKNIKFERITRGHPRFRVIF